MRAATASPVSDQDFEPFSETVRVELVVEPRMRMAPQVDIEQRRQLSGCRQGNELARRVEAVPLNQLMQRLWRELRHQSIEVWAAPGRGFNRDIDAWNPSVP